MTEEELRALELPAKFKDDIGEIKMVKFVGSLYVIYDNSRGVEYSKSIGSSIENWTHIKREEKVTYHGDDGGEYIGAQWPIKAANLDDYKNIIKLTRIYENNELIDVERDIVK